MHMCHKAIPLHSVQPGQARRLDTHEQYDGFRAFRQGSTARLIGTQQLCLPFPCMMLQLCCTDSHFAFASIKGSHQHDSSTACSLTKNLQWSAIQKKQFWQRLQTAFVHGGETQHYHSCCPLVNTRSMCVVTATHDRSLALSLKLSALIVLVLDSSSSVLAHTARTVAATQKYQQPVSDLKNWRLNRK